MSTPKPQTITYKTISSLPIEFDLYLPPKPQNLPILVWFHGGGLLQGTRRSVAPHMLRGVTKYNYALIAADYRLAPQVDVLEVLSDAIDCLRFTRSELAQHIEPGALDTSRIVVSGSSAGGYLALLAGLYADPKPSIVLAIYPITDPLGSFFMSSQPHPDGIVSRETVAEFLNRDAEAMSSSLPGSNRSKMYYWMLQEAILADLLGVKKGDETFIIADQIKKRGREALPPVFVVHGDADKFVGVEQADEIVQALEDVGGVVEYERVEGMDHLFDKQESVGMDRMYAFMGRHL